MGILFLSAYPHVDSYWWPRAHFLATITNNNHTFRWQGVRAEHFPVTVGNRKRGSFQRVVHKYRDLHFFAECNDSSIEHTFTHVSSHEYHVIVQAVPDVPDHLDNAVGWLEGGGLFLSFPTPDSYLISVQKVSPIPLMKFLGDGLVFVRASI